MHSFILVRNKVLVKIEYNILRIEHGAISDSISLILTIFLRLKKQNTKEIKIYLKSIISNKKFLLYFIPWLMFCFIDAFEAPILQVFIKQNFGKMYLMR